MFRAFVRLTTGVELGGTAITLFIGVSAIALMNVTFEGNTGLLATGLIAVATVGVVAKIGTVIWRRYRRLLSGSCGHPACHGRTESRSTLPEHLVICSSCKWVWPRLRTEPVEATVG